MRWVDWKFIKENEQHYPGVQDSFVACGVADFVGQKFTNWNDELIMQFYSTAHFYPDGRIVWMSEGTRYQSTLNFCGTSNTCNMLMACPLIMLWSPDLGNRVCLRIQLMVGNPDNRK